MEILDQWQWVHVFLGLLLVLVLLLVLLLANELIAEIDLPEYLLPL